MATCTGPQGTNDRGCSFRVNGVLGEKKVLPPDTPAPCENVRINGSILAFPKNGDCQAGRL